MSIIVNQITTRFLIIIHFDMRYSIYSLSDSLLANTILIIYSTFFIITHIFNFNIHFILVFMHYCNLLACWFITFIKY